MKPVNVDKVFSNAARDLHRIGACKRMFASPMLFEALLRRLETDLVYRQLSGEDVLPKSGIMYFKGVPVTECDQLKDLDYAFVPDSCTS